MELQLITKSLSTLIEKANKEHLLASDNAKHLKQAMITQIRHTINVGKLLLRAKHKCKHGEWETLFDESNRGFIDGCNPLFAFGKEHARIYMKAATYPQQAKLSASGMETFRLKDVYSSLSDATAEKEEIIIGQHSLNEDDEYHTPCEYIESARIVMGSIDCDPASNDLAQETVKAQTYYTLDDSGLDQPWVGNVWLNPPYSRIITEFSEHLVKQWGYNNTRAAIVLTNNGTDTAWFHNFGAIATSVCLLKGRIKFLKNGVPIDNNNKGQVIFYIGNHPDLFEAEFSQYGLVFNA